MHEKFRTFTDKLHPKFEQLISMDPVVTGKLPKKEPRRVRAGSSSESRNGRCRRLSCRPSSSAR